MASDDLRRQCDTFVELADLATIVGRPRQTGTGGLPRFIQGETHEREPALDEPA